MSTSELEEERRLFYVVLTRRASGIFDVCTTRYRWGKLTESEPSRFIEEIDPQYLEYLTPAENNYRYKPMIDSDILVMLTNQNYACKPQWDTTKAQ
jgi:DNA helicase-2/ATP-dependent DNA helicase PcrA